MDGFGKNSSSRLSLAPYFHLPLFLILTGFNRINIHNCLLVLFT